MNRFQLAAILVRKSIEDERTGAVARDANADRLRHLELAIETCDQITDALEPATDKASALAIMAEEQRREDFDEIHADTRDDAASAYPVGRIRGEIERLS